MDTEVVETIKVANKRGRKKEVVISESTTKIEAGEKKECITDSYTRNAIERYREKNINKAREYNRQYNQKRKEEKIKENPYYGLSKQDIYKKIQEMQDTIKNLEEQLANYQQLKNTSIP